MAKKEIKNEVEEIVEEKVEEPKEKVTEYTGDLRGFKTLDDAKNYPETPEFKRLDKGCQTEYKDWLKSIM